MGQLPNFFVLGAARCGTTTLYETLAAHPQVFLSEPKEPSFFCEPFQIVRDPITYAELFDGAKGAVAVGEASHVYLTHPKAAKTLHAYVPEARFLLVLRNPADRAWSLYNWARTRGYEHIPTFERALRAEERRSRSRRFAERRDQFSWNFLYFRSGLFGEQIERYLAVYPRDRFYLTTLYELTRDPGGVLGHVHRFLGIEPRETHGVTRVNSNAPIRSVVLRRAELRILNPLARRGVPGTRRARARLHTWNSDTSIEFDRDLRQRLIEQYRPDLERLRALTDLDVLADEQRFGATTPASTDLPS